MRRAGISRAVALAVITTVIGMTAILSAQDGLKPAKLLNPGTDSWPTHNGDYSGRRFSTLKAVDAANVKTLSLAWLYTIPAGGPIKSTPLMLDGILYFSTPDP
jgi:alcohol dehydrogenase (cytochrome c)